MTDEDMGFLIISEGGDGLGLAIRLQAEGHPTSMWIRESDAEKRGECLVNKNSSPEFKPIVIADCTGSGSLLEVYKNNEVPTFGGSLLMDRMEQDREFSSEIFSEAGIDEPASRTFSSANEAFGFLEKFDDSVRFVFKPCGKLSGNVPSYVAHNLDDLRSYISTNLEKFDDNETMFVLQEFIPGIAISSEAWFSKDHFILPFNHTLERKQFLNDDLGPSGGCLGNVVWACEEPGCPLCENLLKLEEFLKENAYNGPIDINSVVSKDGDIYALEFTPRFGYDAFPTFLYALFDGNFGDLIYLCSVGQAPSEMPLRSGFAAGVRISVPPWPSEDFPSKEGQEIGGINAEDFNSLSSFYPYEVSYKEKGLITSGGVGIIGVANGYGNSIDEAFEQAYKLANKIILSDKQYRTDLSEVFKSDLRKIRRALGVSV